MIITDLLSNLAILFSLIFLYTQFSSPLRKTSNLARKIQVGLFGGLLGIVLMLYSIHLGNTRIDLRHIPIILMSFYGGAVPSVVSMVLIIIGRFLFGFNTSSYAAVILMISITIISISISKISKSDKMKIMLILTFSNVIYSFIYIFLIRDFYTDILLIPVFWGISYLAGFVAFYIVEYLRQSQELFNQYKSEAAIDGLTGLYNVRTYNKVFNQLLRNLERKNEKLSLLFIDIDFFKKVNDTYGHKEGDMVLRELGAILKNSTRSFDIVSRNGGEEFTVLLLDCALNKSLEISERIRKMVESHPFMLSSGENIHITVSIGIASFDDTTKDPSLLKEDADNALYQAKQTGRNKVCVSNNVNLNHD